MLEQTSANFSVDRFLSAHSIETFCENVWVLADHLVNNRLREPPMFKVCKHVMPWMKSVALHVHVVHVHVHVHVRQSTCTYEIDLSEDKVDVYVHAWIFHVQIYMYDSYFPGMEK